MSMRRLNVPLRLKIVAFLSVILGVSLLSYLYLAQTLFIQDKSSYIYDFSSAETRGVADVVQSHVQNTVTTAKVIASLMTGGSRSGRHSGLEHADQSLAPSLGVSGIAFIRPRDDRNFAVVNESGFGGDQANRLLDQLGWTPRAYDSAEVLIGDPIAGKLPVGAKVKDKGGSVLAFVALVDLDPALLKASARGFETLLIDSKGRGVFPSKEVQLDAGTIASLDRSIPQGKDLSGAMDWVAGGRQYLLSYRRQGLTHLLFVSFISKKAAFAAATTLIDRSLLIGMGIFLFAMGFALLLSRNLTSMLRQIWNATNTVRQGDFTVQVKDTSWMKDEVSDLTESFNLMSVKIKDLLIEAAAKARMEKELETAKIVQETLFPPQTSRLGPLQIAGFYQPASECSGDWWYYCEIQGRYFVWIGDATGHGVPAALITSAARATAALIENISPSLSERMTAAKAMQLLNRSIFDASKGRMNMTFFLACFDPGTGELTYSNASHNPPYLLSTKEDGSRVLSALLKAKGYRLGESAETEYDQSTVLLRPGDGLIMYTDGIYDLTDGDGKMFGKKRARATFEKAGIEKDSAVDMLQEIRNEVSLFGPAGQPVDDVTFLIFKYSPASTDAEITLASEQGGNA